MKGDEGRLNVLLFLLNGPEGYRSECGFSVPPIAVALGLGLWRDGPVRVCSKDRHHTIRKCSCGPALKSLKSICATREAEVSILPAMPVGGGRSCLCILRKARVKDSVPPKWQAGCVREGR